MRGKYNVTHLDISTWEGMSFDATHYYGKLYNGDEVVQVERRLSKKDADKLNEKDKCCTYKDGMTTDRFDFEEDIIEFSKKIYKGRFPKSNVLLLGSPVYYEPMVVLDCPSGFNSASALAIYLDAKKLNFYANKKNDIKMNELMQKYDKLFE